jgi:hypothetical protein
MARTIGKITLGTVGEFRMLGLTVPGIDTAQDRLAHIRLPADHALRLLLTIFEKQWKLDDGTQAKLLKVSPSTLRRYRARGSVPRGREQLQRIEDLLRCHKALSVLFPYNPELADSWPTLRNRCLEPSPVAYAMRHGTAAIRRHLEAELMG